MSHSYPDRLRLEQAARKLRALEAELWVFAPAQALKVAGCAQELELRYQKLTRLAEIEVRA